MTKKVKHLLGISGGKDSAALAIYLHDKYPTLPVEYYFSDTGKELDDTYTLLENIESYLGKKILRIKAAKNSHFDNPFDHFLNSYGGYLPSAQARWCTKKLKLEPFENDVVKNELSISYVGIRNDEDREGYISKKENIQSIFPFRKNIWSEDVIRSVLSNSNKLFMAEIALDTLKNGSVDIFTDLILKDVTESYPQKRKLNDLLTVGIKEFNQIVFNSLKDKNLPLSYEDVFPLVDNEDGLNRNDIFALLEKSGVGVPAYYKKVEFEVDGQKGYYSRSRSGCFFCFFQQKIEWVWLYEQHRELFNKSLEYEKDGFTWMSDEKLTDLIKPERIRQIKLDYIKKTERQAQNQSSEFLIDTLIEAEGVGCNACFV
ncbi:MAG: phosphoadenosine phosphosulfate reductase [Ignavibacteriales bacterium CG18_big_fil_WC_8_21_14_2_50_31_20]|nr:MAG: phosphoadenosine phosphosulfate reductase [Ignavibacteriales bacterium CG18_big_fil_WC_8_21_14_2_50_31_20]